MPPPRTRADARHDQRVASDIGRNPVGREAGGGGGEPVALLHLELGETLHARLALGEGGDGGEHRIFVDHAGRALGRDAHALQAREAHADVGDGLAALLALVAGSATSAPISRSVR